MKNILITGSTGYIGRRLANRLVENPDLSIKLLVRNKKKVQPSMLRHVEIIEGSTFDTEALKQALNSVDAAFYLIHSMGTTKDFEEKDRVSAENFRKACIAAGVKRLVYLGGLGDKATASQHLRSRIETGEILSAEPEKIQTIWLRAGIIIGSGSASFEILRNLVQKLAFMVTPRWVSTKTQPIAIDDVISYLEASIHLESEDSQIIDIGSDTLSFKQMIERTAELMGLKRRLLPVPVLSPRISSYWLLFFTSVPLKVACALVEGLKSETVVLNDNADRLFPHIKPLSFDESIVRAISEIEKNEVISRWCDSDSGEACDIAYNDTQLKTVFRKQYSFQIKQTTGETVFKSLSKLGGESGWYAFNFLWQLRGWVDKLLGGYGTSRGRRDENILRVGDALDFWKVLDVKDNKRLLLSAQMKAPGKGWLEFNVQGQELNIIIHFLPNGVWGRLYWVAFLPWHNLIFDRLGKKLTFSKGSLSQSNGIQPTAF